MTKTNNPPELSGAEIILESLHAEGVDTVFGYPGGASLQIYDALHADDRITHVLTRHEQAAVHAADGYARTVQRPGVVFTTSGPGATNIVTGLANAYMDSVPVVAITAQVATPLLGKDSFQEADIVGITIPITKYSCLVRDVRDLARAIREAFQIATSGRPGPVLVDVPKDVTIARTGFSYPPPTDLAGYGADPGPDEAGIDRALEYLRESRRPLLFVGGGVRSPEAVAGVRRLAETLDLPVAWSLMGKGVIPDPDPRNIGMVGMHGMACANYAFGECDLLLGIGVRFDDRVTGKTSEFARRARIVHVDIDAAEIGKIVPAAVGICGDAGAVVSRMLEKLQEREPAPDRSAWQARLREWRETHPLCYRQADVIKPQYVIETLNQLTGGTAFASTEVGQNQMWSAQYLSVGDPAQFVSSGGLGTMGFGLPAAVGMQIARPGDLVVSLSGDGSFQMNLQELQTIRERDLPVKILILNNGCLGMVRQWQDLFYEKRYSCTVFEGQPDFVKLADAYGIPARRIGDPAAVREGLEEALSHQGPYLLDFVVDKEENVFPMVPAGGSLDEMLRGGGGTG